MVQRLKKDYDGAIASYQKVLDADPNNDKREDRHRHDLSREGRLRRAEKALIEVASTR